MKDTSINDALRVIRKANDYSLRRLAREISIDVSYLSRVENGQQTPNLELLRKYSETLGISLATIMLFAEGLQVPSAEEKKLSVLKENAAKAVMKLMVIMDKLSDSHKETTETTV